MDAPNPSRENNKRRQETVVVPFWCRENVENERKKIKLLAQYPRLKLDKLLLLRNTDNRKCEIQYFPPLFFGFSAVIPETKQMVQNNFHGKKRNTFTQPALSLQSHTFSSKNRFYPKRKHKRNIITRKKAIPPSKQTHTSPNRKQHKPPWFPRKTPDLGTKRHCLKTAAKTMFGVCFSHLKTSVSKQGSCCALPGWYFLWNPRLWNVRLEGSSSHPQGTVLLRGVAPAVCPC